MNAEQRIAGLESELATHWQEILDKNAFIQRIMTEKVDRRLYEMYMAETYHYTRHNARNQALVGATARSISPGYMKFCFEHAAEETGHENMALKDLETLGYDRELVLNSRPLLETEALISYLYWISLTANPVARLGYSFWAEAVYHYINPVLEKLKKDLELNPRNMTFFIAHAEIDQDHAEEVRKIIAQSCKTEDDWDAVRDVMHRSLDLTAKLLEGVLNAYDFRRIQ